MIAFILKNYFEILITVALHICFPVSSPYGIFPPCLILLISIAFYQSPDLELIFIMIQEQASTEALSLKPGFVMIELRSLKKKFSACSDVETTLLRSSYIAIIWRPINATIAQPFFCFCSNRSDRSDIVAITESSHGNQAFVVYIKKCSISGPSQINENIEKVLQPIK